MSEMTRIAVVDDHPLFRQGVVAVLAAEPTMEVVAQGGSGPDAIMIAEQQLPDLMLVDISMPGDGLMAARKIAQVYPVVKIIMLTVSESDEHVHAALEAGARGYVLKGVSGTELLRTMQSVLKGETYVTPALAARLLTQSRLGSQASARDLDYSALTMREEEILDEVARGLTNKEIALQLGIAEKTVKHYMTNIMEKLQVRNRVEAALRTRGPAIPRETTFGHAARRSRR